MFSCPIPQRNITFEWVGCMLPPVGITLSKLWSYSLSVLFVLFCFKG